MFAYGFNIFQPYTAKEARVVPFKHSFEIRRERHGAEGEDGLARVVHISNMHELPGTLPASGLRYALLK